MTVRTKVLLSYLSVLLLAAITVLGAGWLLRTYFEGTRPTGDRRAPPLARMASALNATARAINLQILEDPEGFLDPQRVEALAPPMQQLGLMVRRGDQVVLRSASLESVAELPPLPPFGIATEWKIPVQLPAQATPVGQWDFRFSDGVEGSLFMVIKPLALRRRPLLSYGDLVILFSIVALVVGNGLATLLIYRNVIRPLSTLRQAAERISAGDLDTPLQTPLRPRRRPPLRTVKRRGDEIGQLETAFENMRVRLGDLLARQHADQRSRQELIAGISHDLRTPVTAIKGYVEGIRDGVAATPEKTARYLQTIADKVDVVDRLIEELLLLSTLDAREIPFDWRKVDLGAFLEDSVEELRLRHEARGIRIDLQRADGAVHVRADPTRLRRVMENIVDNAVRHGDAADPHIAIELHREGENARIAVSDNGSGIPAADLPHVFDRFYRVDTARSTAGSGLGLAIARSLIEAHGGSIRADCPPAKGTRITIDLPLAGEPAP